MPSGNYTELAFSVDVIEVRRRDGGPMRDALRLHPHQEVRMVPSWKCGWRIYTTMGLERKYARIFEVDGRVKWYRSQPLTLEFMLDGKSVQYTPDFEVAISDTVIIVETKPALMLARSPKLQRKLDEVKRIYADRGKPWIRLGSSKLPPVPWMDAAADIEARGRTLIDPLDEQRVLRSLQENGPATLQECASRVRRHSQPENAVLSMILRSRRIEAEMNGPIWPGTVISLR
jgi:hypothetical protein